MDYKKMWEELRGYLEISKIEHGKVVEKYAAMQYSCQSNQEYFAGKEQKSKDTLLEMTRLEKESK